MKVIAYIRVSTDGQTGEDRFGLEVQKETIAKYCYAHTPRLEIVKWVSDEGESGAKERKGFDSIIYGDVGNPPYDAVVVAKTDRVARDINLYYYYKMLLKKKGLDLISCAEDYGQFGTLGQMLESFIVCVAQIERENIQKRTSGGRVAKAKQGGYAGGKSPLGYRVENSKYVVEPYEAEIVRLIFSLKKQGESIRGIAQEISRQGYRSRNGKVISPSTVQSVLKNQLTYCGYYKYSDEDWVVGVHEPILVEGEF